MPSFFEELRRRKVVKVAIGYAIVGWLLVEVAATVLPIFEAPLWVAQVFTFFVILGFPLALILSWAFDITPEGVRTTPGVGESRPTPTQPAGQKLNGLILGVMAAALIFLVLNQLLPQRAAPGAAASSAIGTSSRIQRLSIDIGPTQPIGNTGLSAHIDLSPDGSRIVYTAQVDGQARLYLRSVDDFETRPIPGTEGGYHPFFSPGGDTIAFFSDTTDQKLKRVSVAGGAPVTLADATISAGGTWDSGGGIIFVNSNSEGARFLERVDVANRAIETVIPPSTQVWPAFPEVLPVGDAVLFTARPANEPASAGSVAVLSLESGEIRTVIASGHSARYSPSGHLVFVRDNSLWAVAFDMERLTTSGQEVAVVEGVEEDSQFGGMAYSFSDDGMLAYLDADLSAVEHNFVWVDRGGAEESIAAEAGVVQDVSLSPDGRRLAYALLASGGIDIWIQDLDGGNPVRFTFNPAYDYAPIWTPDGDYIVFQSERDGGGIYRKRVDFSGQSELLLASGVREIPESFAANGRELIYRSGEPPQFYVLSLDGNRAPRPLLQSEFRLTHASVSPDGRWLAYVSDEGGRRDEVFVVQYPNGGGKQQISYTGGTEPRWNPDGSELFYAATLNGAFTAVPVVPDAETFSPGSPIVLFERRYSYYFFRNYAVAPDAERFVMTRPVASADTEAGVTLLSVVNNWFEELERLVPREL